MSHIGKFLETASQPGLPGAGVGKRMGITAQSMGFLLGAPCPYSETDLAMVVQSVNILLNCVLPRR